MSLVQALPLGQLAALFGEQCAAATDKSSLEPLHDLLKATLDTHDVPADTLDTLLLSFQSVYQRLDALDANGKALLESVYGLFLARNAGHQDAFVVQLAASLAEHSFFIPLPSALATIAPASTLAFFQDAAEGLEMASRLLAESAAALQASTINRLFEIAVAAVVCFDREVRGAAIALLPVLVRELQSRGSWAAAHVDTVYRRLLDMAPSPAVAIDAPQLVAALLPVLESPVVLPRVLGDDSFFALLMTALVHAEPAPRKFALHAVKHLAELVCEMPARLRATYGATSRLFPLQDPKLKAAWDAFFLTYDFVAESYHHLVRTAFPMLETHLAASPLPIDWWLVVLEHGLLNDSLASRKLVMQFILDTRGPALDALAAQPAFLGRFITATEPTVLYAVNVQGAFASPFGESVARFWAQLLTRRAALADLVFPRLRDTRSLVFLLFGLQGVAETCAETPLALPGGATEVAKLCRNMSPISDNSRRLLERLVVDVLVRTQRVAGAEPASCVAPVLASLRYFDHPDLAAWVRAHAGIGDAALSHVAEYLTTPRALEVAVKDAAWLARLVACLDSADRAAVTVEIAELAAQVYTHPYLAPGVPELRIALVVSLGDTALVETVGNEVAAYLAMATRKVNDHFALELYERAAPVFARFMDAASIATAAYETLFAPASGGIESELSRILAVVTLRHLLATEQTRGAVLAGIGAAALNVSAVLTATLTRPTGSAATTVPWNDLVTHFTSAKWDLVLALTEPGSRARAYLVDSLIDEIENDHREGSAPLIRCVAQCMDDNGAAEQFSRALGVAWDLVAAAASIPRHFGILYPAFLDLVAAPRFVRNPTMRPAVEMYLGKILALGATKFGVVDRAVAAVHATLAQDMDLVMAYSGSIVEWLKYGPARDRDEERQETVWLGKLEAVLAPSSGDADGMGANTDYRVRVFANDLAARLGAHPVHGPALFAKLMDVLVNDPQLHPRLEFPNQGPNRHKLRLLSTLLVLAGHPACVPTAAAPGLVEAVAGLLDAEPAINLRPYYEWLLALLVLRNLDAGVPRVFADLTKYNDRASTVASKMAVVAHLVRALDDWVDQPGAAANPVDVPRALADLATLVFLHTTPWLATNHFTVRLHAQWVLGRTWAVCERRRDSHPALAALLGRPDLAALVAYTRTNRDCVKFNAKYLLAAYLANDFHPVRDRTWEFVFHMLPRLATDTAPDEFISSRAFAGVVPQDEGGAIVALADPTRTVYLRHDAIEDPTIAPTAPDVVAAQPVAVTSAPPASARIADSAAATAAVAGAKKGGRNMVAEAASVVVQPPAPTATIDTANTPAMPVQRKINAAMATMLHADAAGEAVSSDTNAKPVSDEDKLTRLQAAIRTRGARGRLDLIVCASLVDLATNLGGLARTCEIFGVRALAVHSARVQDDPTFRALAVSADRHLPLVEVPRGPALADWLRTMRREHHYTVVALEQTSASVRLDAMGEMPAKVIVLLGKEKEGVPADLLAAGDIVDVCIEIPQLGNTRSLNVHNSAAILVWEYVRRALRA
ncbi:hypothetical protein H9P43_005375 [Blastocladiella emersonii ATCC 22665]|nr:hypothetical protein H9P43_005375 [Blastocladiella emersonii ATCC 22665]